MTSPPVQIDEFRTSILALDAVRLQRRYGTGKSLTFEKVVEQHPVAAITTENKAAGNNLIGSVLN
jgi:hypothetical protein